jgi:hypothetical protein
VRLACRAFKHLGDSEVSQFHGAHPKVAFSRDEDIRRFQITVKYAARMDMKQRCTYLDENSHDRFLREACALLP